LAQSRNLRFLHLPFLGLHTSHCRAIDALTRTDLQIELVSCEPTESGEDIFFWRAFDKIEARLNCLRAGLTHVVSPKQCEVTAASSRSPYSNDEERLVLVEALAENEGLVTLNLESTLITDEVWVAVWQSVAHHPTLENIRLPQYSSTWRDGTTDARKTLRMQVMVDALRVNIVLHTIELRRVDFDGVMLDSTVYPLLLANKYRPRVGAIAEVEGPWRRKLLERAVGSISINPSLI
jgi:hypothetical protein